MVGIGLRKEFLEEFIDGNSLNPDFVEVAPENWIDVGGYWENLFNKVVAEYPLFLHGLSLSIGSPDKIDLKFLKQVKKFIKENNALIYSEHLSFSKLDNAHIYDLLPIPFTMEAVQHVSKRINEVQDYLEQKIAIEIVSYYSPIAAELTELEFINAILGGSNCDLLLDVNNIFVNGFNHNYDPYQFVDGLKLDNVKYIHIAGHTKVSDNLIIDTHGENIIDPVYELLDYTLPKLSNNVPILLERDFNIPELNELEVEMNNLKKIQSKHWK